MTGPLPPPTLSRDRCFRFRFVDDVCSCPMTRNMDFATVYAVLATLKILIYITLHYARVLP